MALRQQQKVFAADGSSDALPWRGGEGHVLVEGTIGGGTLTLQWRYGTAAWIAAGAATTFTATGAGIFTLPGEVEVRATLSGATNPDLTVSIF